MNTPSKRDLILLTCLALGLRWLMLPWAETVDADAVSRMFLAKQWAARPEWIGDGVWGPFQSYLFGILFWFTDNHVWASAWLQTVISAATVIPLYLLGSRLYGRAGGWACALFFVMNPVILHNSFQGLSFAPFALLAAWSMWFFIRAFENESDVRSAAWSGVMLTLASGFRFEAWLLIALFFLILQWHKGWKIAGTFALVASVFPAIWMLGNTLVHGNPLFSITPSESWWNESLGMAEFHPEIQLQRILFFPLSFSYLFQPILLVFFVAMTVYLTVRKKWKKSWVIWWIPFLIVTLIWMSKVWSGSMFMQHRFTSILLLLIAPLVGILTIAPGVRWINHTLLFGLLALNLGSSFYYSRFRIESVFMKPKVLHDALYNFRVMGLEQTTPIPRLKSGKVRPWAAKLQVLRPEEAEGLILDFMGWEETYYLAFQSGWHPDQILLVPGGWEGEFKPQSVQFFFDREMNTVGTLLIQKNSKFERLFGPDEAQRFFEGNGIRIELQELDRDQDFILYRYTWKKTD